MEHLSQGPILNIIVVGFHHKKGCQIEFVYPNNLNAQRQCLSESCFNATDSNFTLPKRWKHLPSLALPDGSQNY